ncbi:MAG: TatD family hydrolase [Desulfobacteraceae bacterium]|nr:TatD family hydrolase [Desulfobacteraceae bacterium]
MKRFDAHCHLQDQRLSQRLSRMLQTWNSSGGGFLVSCGTQEPDWADLMAIAGRTDTVLPCFGVHPWYVETVSPAWEENLGGYLERIPSGVGEIGLDFTSATPDRQLQEAVFKSQLALAHTLGLPVSIHIRKAWDSFIRILKHMGPLAGGGLIHSFSGSADMVPMFERHNLYISFSGTVTNPGNKKVGKALKAVSRDRLLIETDSPDLLPRLPEPVEDGINTPANLPVVAEAAATLLEVPMEILVQQTFDNGTRLFNRLTNPV